jgi:hypothetical protein
MSKADSSKSRPICNFFKRIAPRKASTTSSGTGAKVEGYLDLLQSLRSQLTDEAKALDTRAGIVISLAIALSVASYVGAVPFWSGLCTAISVMSAFLGVVALLTNTLENGEPGMSLVLQYGSQELVKEAIKGQPASVEKETDRLEVERRWVRLLEDALITRKRWMLASYIALVASGTTLAITHILQPVVMSPASPM